LPKIEDYEDYLFMVTHAVDYTRAEKFETTELDLFLGKEFLVTYHRTALRSVSALIDRLAKNVGPGPRGPDRLAHTLLDLMVDNYTPMMGELHGELEEIVLGHASSKEFVSELLQVRKDFTRLRHIIRPQREIIDRLARGDSKMIRATLLPYYRDLRDNLARIEETAMGYHERLMMAFDIYLNKAAFEANDGIKFLTALTAITIPVMIVGTWYGMNFDHMKELSSPHGYHTAVGVTLFFTLLTAIYLKRRKWF
jgi:magnesium transporter